MMRMSGGGLGVVKGGAVERRVVRVWRGRVEVGVMKRWE